MPLIVRDLSLRWDEPEENLHRQIARVLGVSPKTVRSFGVIRRSLDARKRHEVRWVYHVEAAIDADEGPVLKRCRPNQVSPLRRETVPPVDSGAAPMEHRPVIIGSGPAGLFAALLLAERGYRPILLERGQDVPQRHKAVNDFYTGGPFNPESNLLFGIGGAGTYSDGKLYSRTHDPRNSWVIEQFVRFGADPDILINAKPHVGSDRLPGVCRRMVEQLRQAGGEVRYGARVIDFEMADTPAVDPSRQQRRLRAVKLESGERIPVSVCLLAIGHSARDTYHTLRERGVELAAKPFQMGVRIEHPQGLINRNQFGEAADKLAAADYTLVAKHAAGAEGSGSDLFSFCMCPGGQILPSNESAEEICTNGASNSFRNSPYANSGLVITIMPAEFGDDALQGIEYQRRWERLAYKLSGSYAVPAQRCTDYLGRRMSSGPLKCSYPLGARAVNLRAMLPQIVGDALDKGLPLLERMVKGYAGPEGILTAPETRASSPVRITRDEGSRQSISVAGVYPIGEGAGYAGGIVSSATDGLKSAEAIIRMYAPLK